VAASPVPSTALASASPQSHAILLETGLSDEDETLAEPQEAVHNCAHRDVETFGLAPYEVCITLSRCPFLHLARTPFMPCATARPRWGAAPR
jgi:hypothetical protein